MILHSYEFDSTYTAFLKGFHWIRVGKAQGAEYHGERGGVRYYTIEIPDGTPTARFFRDDDDDRQKVKISLDGKDFILESFHEAKQWALCYDPFEIIITKVKVPEGAFRQSIGFLSPWKYQGSLSTNPPTSCDGVCYHGGMLKKIDATSQEKASILKVGRYLTIIPDGTIFIRSDVHSELLMENTPLATLRKEIRDLPLLWQWGLDIRAKQDKWLDELRQILPSWRICLYEHNRADFCEMNVTQIKKIVQRLREHNRPVYPDDHARLSPSGVMRHLGSRLRQTVADAKEKRLKQNEAAEQDIKAQRRQIEYTQLKTMIEQEFSMHK